jgi:hypothetical protein
MVLLVTGKGLVDAVVWAGVHGGEFGLDRVDRFVARCAAALGGGGRRAGVGGGGGAAAARSSGKEGCFLCLLRIPLCGGCCARASSLYPANYTLPDSSGAPDGGGGSKGGAPLRTASSDDFRLSGGGGLSAPLLGGAAAAAAAAAAAVAATERCCSAARGNEATTSPKRGVAAATSTTTPPSSTAAAVELDVDLSPTMNDALRKEVVYYVTLGIKVLTSAFSFFYLYLLATNSSTRFHYHLCTTCVSRDAGHPSSARCAARGATGSGGTSST